MTSTRLGTLAAMACLLAGLGPAAVDAKTLIHAGGLIDGRSETVRTNVTVTVDADRITGIADGFVAPAAGDVVVDLRDATLMPGLMDMHVHISSQQSGAAGYAERFFLNPPTSRCARRPTRRRR